MLKAVNKKDGIPALVVENHYGWTFIPFLQGFGGNVFRNAPTDLMPVLDSPEAVAAAEFFCNNAARLRARRRAVLHLRPGAGDDEAGPRQLLLQQRDVPGADGEADSKVAKTCALSLTPGGPAGRFPNVAAHGWGIPVGSRNKDAAWEFITWSMSKELTERMFNDHGYSSVTRRSMIDRPEFRQKMQINGIDVAQLYLDTLDARRQGLHGLPHGARPIRRSIMRSTWPCKASSPNRRRAKEAMAQAQQNALTQLKRAGVKL